MDTAVTSVEVSIDLRGKLGRALALAKRCRSANPKRAARQCALTTEPTRIPYSLCFRLPFLAQPSFPGAQRRPRIQSADPLLGGPESTEAVCKRQIGRFGVRCPLQVRIMKTIRIKVKPNARSSGLEKLSDGTWLARVASPPVDGKANEELVRLIAERFSVRKAQVSIKSGASGRLKLVQIADP